MGSCLSSSVARPASRSGAGGAESDSDYAASSARSRRRNRNRRRESILFSDSNSSSVTNGGLHTTKNRPLRKDKIRWKSDVPLTEGQLKSKRDEFWDTAPAFEGKSEIWAALKAAAEAAETNEEFELAQSILDCAGISLPHGSLVEAYDELGTRYTIPVYCLAYPINIVADGEEGGDDSPAECSEPVAGTSVSIVKIKVRVSLVEPDVKLMLKSTDTVLFAKQRLQEVSETMALIEPHQQRWYFGGKLLSDKMRIGDANIPQGYVAQCIISQKEMVKEEEK